MSAPTLPDQSAYLTTLTTAPAAAVKEFVEQLLDQLAAVEVIENRTGLVMLPYTDTAQGTPFFLGEVLVTEAHVRIGESQGYAACLGRDLEQALAIAIVDAILQNPLPNPAQSSCRAFIDAQAARLAEAEATLLRQVEATRVELEVF
jgi:alpha-D-ribose 1-methylphosphonate 5-triphosphate synthase subunit PhnG